MKCTWTFSITTKFEMSPSRIALQKFTRFLDNSKPPMIPEIIWSTSGSSKKNRRPYTSNMGMTAKSHSNKLFFLRYPSLYRSGSLDNCCQNIVSKSLIFLFPQIFRRVQSRKQSLICLDICGTNGEKKNTNRRPRVTCVSESHLLSFFNLSRSKLWKFEK